MITKERFALNRIIYPEASLKDFFDLANSCGINNIELRNDIGKGEIIDSFSVFELNQICEDNNINILSINAIQKFNLPSNFITAQEELKQISTLCNEINCTSIVMCPANDITDKRTEDEFFQDTIDALKLYAPILEEYEISAYVEPLGFPECSLRSKQLAMEAIQIADCSSGIYKIIHDTFHHFLGPDKKFFSDETGLVHISGVHQIPQDTSIRDEHRVLIDENDIMDTSKQIHTLEDEGYKGYYSFEPFAPSVQKMAKTDLRDAINKSLDYLMS